MPMAPESTLPVASGVPHAERARWYYERALRFTHERDTPRARKLLRRAIVFDPTFTDAYRALAGP